MMSLIIIWALKAIILKRTKLLFKKGMFTKEEFLEMVKNPKTKINRKKNSSGMTNG
jgi:hypothetical protein